MTAPSMTAPETPILARHIARATTGSIGFAKNSQLLHFGGKETCVSELEQQVSQAIVPRILSPDKGGPQVNPWFAGKEGTGQR